MRHTGTTYLPLHCGHAPRWLFERMVKLSGAISEAIVMEYGPEELLRRIADPFWFQSFCCVIGFDWHSSGTTTTACGALKMGIKPEIGIFVCGGKGKASRKAPKEIVKCAKELGLDSQPLLFASRLSAKVDNSCVQDNYSLYHHTFFLAENGKWAVVQQGMNPFNNYARRYHWLSSEVKSFVEEPQTAICGFKEDGVLNLTSRENEELRKMSVELVKESPVKIERAALRLPRMHKTPVSPRTLKTLKSIAEKDPKDYQELVGIRGVGTASLRALALVSNVIYGTKIQWKDPVSYSFAHGGKDGFPYPVNKRKYDGTIRLLKEAIDQAKLGKREKLGALKRLGAFTSVK